MKELLKAISEKALLLNDPHFTFKSDHKVNKWLGAQPATEQEIMAAEVKLGIKLPDDYKDFLRITNGFSAPTDIEPTFRSLDKIDWLKNTDPDLINVFHILPELKRAIVIAGQMEEQNFFIIPPENNSVNWRYWKFANWIPGEHAYTDLTHYFKDVLEFIEEELKNN
jgi:cell wall assembly regulator SMI1